MWLYVATEKIPHYTGLLRKKSTRLKRVNIRRTGMVQVGKDSEGLQLIISKKKKRFTMQKPWGSSLCYKLEADLETNLSKPIDITSWLAVYIGIFSTGEAARWCFGRIRRVAALCYWSWQFPNMVSKAFCQFNKSRRIVWTEDPFIFSLLGWTTLRMRLPLRKCLYRWLMQRRCWKNLRTLRYCRCTCHGECC